MGRGEQEVFKELATASYVILPSQRLTPFLKSGEDFTASSIPMSAIFSPYASVQFVRPRVEVRATTPGILETQ